MKGKVILLIAALIAIALTIAIYNLAVTTWTSMIQLSLVIVCVSELAIISCIGLLPVLNFKNGSTGIMINIYAALMIIWSIIGCKLNGSAYPVGLMLISAIMIVVIGMTVMGSHESDRLNNHVEDTISRKHSYTVSSYQTAKSIAVPTDNTQENLSSIWLTIQSCVEDYETKKRLRVLVERIKALPANRFPNPTIESSMSQISAMCRALSNPEAHDRMLQRINAKTIELTNYIKTL